MKTIKTTVAVLTALWCTHATHAQDSDSLGVIGDNLDLYAVLDEFKNAESIEAFEKAINDPDKKINNLDLNEDDEVDYIQVHDEGEKDAYAFVLRIDMGEGEDETQDIAVIELEKTGDNEATVQIVGDEEIYGDDYIIEPKQDEAITKRLFGPQIIVINVWGWPSVRFVFGPRYVRWRSPWRWGLYPRWWKPWGPHRFGVYRGFHAHHRRHYHVVKVRRCGRAHGHYRKRRRTSVKIVHHHHHHHYHKKSGAGNNNKPTGGNNNKPITGNAQKQKQQKTNVQGQGQKQQKTNIQGQQKQQKTNTSGQKQQKTNVQGQQKQQKTNVNKTGHQQQKTNTTGGTKQQKTKVHNGGQKQQKTKMNSGGQNRKTNVNRTSGGNKRGGASRSSGGQKRGGNNRR